MHFRTTLRVPLLEFARVTEYWLSVVAPPSALALRSIRDSWAVHDSPGASPVPP